MRNQRRTNLGYLPLVLAAIVGILSLLLAGCTTSDTTPKGPLGDTVDLRHHLPADVLSRAPSDDKAAQHQVEVQIGEPAALVSIQWRTFKDGESAYLLSVSFEVIEPASGVELWAEVSPGLRNMGTSDAVLEAIPVTINWRRSTLLVTAVGAQGGEIRADGTWRPL